MVQRNEGWVMLGGGKAYLKSKVHPTHCNDFLNVFKAVLFFTSLSCSYEYYYLSSSYCQVDGRCKETECPPHIKAIGDAERSEALFLETLV